MVIIETDRSSTASFVLCSNCSASWKLNLRIVFAIAVVNLLTGVGFSLSGAWLILPFAGLEICALLVATYYWFRYCRIYERVQFSPEEILIEQSNLFNKKHWRCQRFWGKAHVVHEKGRYLPRIRLGCRESQVAIGHFLNKDDKKKLNHELAAYIQIVHQ